LLLTEAVEAYVSRKQLMGRKYVTEGSDLRAFARLYPTIQLSDLRTRHVQTFLNYRPLCRDSWINRYKGVRSFLTSWISRRQLTTFRMPALRKAERRSFNAYIFTPLQMRTILARASEIQSRKLSEITQRCFGL
jgi:hypothetical protein